MMMHPMDWILVAMVTVCGITDIFFNKIYNPVTFSGAIAGFIVALMGHGANTLGGLPVDWAESLTGFLVAFLPFFALFMINAMGGGDLKLMCAIGVIKGVSFVAYTMLYALGFGAVIGIIVTGVRGELLPVLRRVGYTILHTLTPTVGPISHVTTRGPKVNFGLATCLAALLCLIGQLLGRQILDF